MTASKKSGKRVPLNLKVISFTPFLSPSLPLSLSLSLSPRYPSLSLFPLSLSLSLSLLSWPPGLWLSLRPLFKPVLPLFSLSIFLLTGGPCLSSLSLLLPSLSFFLLFHSGSVTLLCCFLSPCQPGPKERLDGPSALPIIHNWSRTLL